MDPARPRDPAASWNLEYMATGTIEFSECGSVRHRTSNNIRGAQRLTDQIECRKHPLNLADQVLCANYQPVHDLHIHSRSEIVRPTQMAVLLFKALGESGCALRRGPYWEGFVTEEKPISGIFQHSQIR